MKRIFLIATVVMLGFASTNAQTTVKKDPPFARAKTMTGNVSDACTLQSEQWPKVSSVWVDYYTALDKLDAEKATIGDAAYKSKLNNLKENRTRAMDATLTPDQQAKWAAYVKTNKID